MEFRACDAFAGFHPASAVHINSENRVGPGGGVVQRVLSNRLLLIAGEIDIQGLLLARGRKQSKVLDNLGDAGSGVRCLTIWGDILDDLRGIMRKAE